MTHELKEVIDSSISNNVDLLEGLIHISYIEITDDERETADEVIDLLEQIRGVINA